MTIKLDIAGEDLVRVRKRRSPHRSGKIRKPVEPRGKITREVINDARETIMKKTDKVLIELSRKTLADYANKAKYSHDAETEKWRAFANAKDKMTNTKAISDTTDLANKSFDKAQKRKKGLTQVQNRFNTSWRPYKFDEDKKKVTKEETEIPETPVVKKSIQEMYKKEPISADLVGRIMSKITPEVLESLGPLKPAKGEQSTKALGPKKPKSTVDKIKDSSLT